MKIQRKPDHGLSAEEYDALTRDDFWIFVQRVFVEQTGKLLLDNFHIQKLCAEVSRMLTEGNVRLAIALPPRSLKSIIVSVALPAWLLGHDPSLEIVCVSYGQELSDKHSADFRRIVLSPWYRRLFPKTKLDRQAIDHLTTTEGGKRYATSVGGTLTGMGAEVIIVDDPMKPDEALSDAERTRINQWAQHTLFTRMNDKNNDRIIVVMQRLHEADMIGHMTELGNFELLSFPAIALEDEVHLIKTPYGTLPYERKAGEALHPEREPLETLEKQRQQLGTDFFSAQYLQLPTPPGGGIIKLHWFRRYEPDKLPSFKMILQSWDCAAKPNQPNAFSVCTTLGVTKDNHAYLLHMFRERLEYPDLKRKVRQLAHEQGAHKVLIEDTSAGTQLIQDFRREGFTAVQGIRPKGDKATRMLAQTPDIESGKVFLPQHASWLAEFEHELAMFPKGRHSDQADSLSQALDYVRTTLNSHWTLEGSQRYACRERRPHPDKLTVTFSYTGSTFNVDGVNGREISPDADGYYRATPEEWQSIAGIPGTTRINSAK